VFRNEQDGARKTSAPSACGGFTLIELLTVVLIIAVLASLTLIGIIAVRRSMDKNTARTEAQALAKAMQSYRNTYSRWPGQKGANEYTYSDGTGGDQNQADIIIELQNNPRELDLFRDDDYYMDNNRCLDPWGNEYVVAMDVNGDGLTVLSSTAHTPGMDYIVTSDVAVASWGSDPNDGKHHKSWDN